MGPFNSVNFSWLIIDRLSVEFFQGKFHKSILELIIDSCPRIISANTRAARDVPYPRESQPISRISDIQSIIEHLEASLKHLEAS